MTVPADIKAGIYRHYKGPLYLVLGLAHDANAGDLYTNELGKHAMYDVDFKPVGEREVVVYIALQLDDAHTGARLDVRTAEDFFTEVCTNVTHVHHYGQGWTQETCKPHRRFEYVGPRWDG